MDRWSTIQGAVLAFVVVALGFLTTPVWLAFVLAPATTMFASLIVTPHLDLAGLLRWAPVALAVDALRCSLLVADGRFRARTVSIPNDTESALRPAAVGSRARSRWVLAVVAVAAIPFIAAALAYSVLMVASISGPLEGAYWRGLADGASLGGLLSDGVARQSIELRADGVVDSRLVALHVVNDAWLAACGAMVLLGVVAHAGQNPASGSSGGSQVPASAPEREQIWLMLFAFGPPLILAAAVSVYLTDSALGGGSWSCRSKGCTLPWLDDFTQFDFPLVVTGALRSAALCGLAWAYRTAAAMIPTWRRIALR